MVGFHFELMVQGSSPVCCLVLLFFATTLAAEVPANLRRENLVAWCIVPFDAAERGPSERSTMLAELGLRRCAYDWRSKHVAEFEEEILQYEKHGIEYFAFWGQHDQAFRLFGKYGLLPQIWNTLPIPGKATQDENVASATKALLPLAKHTGEMGCKLGLYNHGGWGGEPANLIAVCRALRAAGHRHVGIVYNWHHGHARIGSWAEDLKEMQPFLHCVNLNGMNSGAKPKILTLGHGEHELSMLRTLIKSGYTGAIGILDHQAHLDAREVLSDNLDGLAWLTGEILSPGSAGPRPTPGARSQDK